MSGAHLTPELAAADAVLAGAFTLEEVLWALRGLRGRSSPWLRRAARQVVEHFGVGRRLLRAELAGFFVDNGTFQRAFAAAWPMPSRSTQLGVSRVCSQPSTGRADADSGWCRVFLARDGIERSGAIAITIRPAHCVVPPVG